jgi:hypothetical protein
MAATFDTALPTARDRMRYAVGDTDVAAAPLEQDETYDAVLALYGESLGTAVIAEALASRFAKEPDSISDDTGSVRWSERVKTWIAVANRYRAGGATSGSTGASSIVLTRDDEDADEYGRDIVLTAVHGWTG